MPAAPPLHAELAGRLIVLFDGDCVLCNNWARFIAARDPRCQFALGTLQSATGRELLRARGLSLELSSVVFLWPGGAAVKSAAILRMMAHLSAPWPLAAALRLIPRFLRDAGYDLIARHRYRWFGRAPACPLPTPELRARLLE